MLLLGGRDNQQISSQDRPEWKSFTKEAGGCHVGTVPEFGGLEIVCNRCASHLGQQLTIYKLCMSVAWMMHEAMSSSMRTSQITQMESDTEPTGSP